MNYEEQIKLEPQKYWNLPINASINQKEKMKQSLRSNDYIASLKVDGCLYTLCKGADENDIKLLSRTKSKKDNEFVDKIDNLPHIKEWAKKLPNNTIIVGEVCCENILESKSNKVTKIMGCKANTAVKRQQEANSFMTYYIFDVLRWNDEDLTDLINEERINKGLNYVRTFLADNFEDFIKVAIYFDKNIPQLTDELLEKGFEGIVALRKKAKWKSGRTSAWDSIKVKQTLSQTLDCVIMGYKMPKPDCSSKELETWNYWQDLKTGELAEGKLYTHGGYKPVNQNYFYGFVSAFEIGLYKKDELVSVGFVSNLTLDVREEIKNGKDYVGKVVEVQAMELNDVDDVSLRHAKIVRYRDDKEPKECLWEQIGD